MMLAFLLLLISTLGGVAVTYLYDEDAPLAVRFAAGAVIGTSLVGLLGFLLAYVFGFNLTTVVCAALFSALPLLVFSRPAAQKRLQTDTAVFNQQWREFFLDFNLTKFGVVSLYAGLTALLWFFFERTMLEMRGGAIGTGAVNNLGDLPFHLLVINNFVYGQNFGADNPLYAGGTFTYSFITDLVVAMMHIGGASVRHAMFAQNMTLVIALVILLARFTHKLTGSTAAALIAPFLLLFNGGLGFLLYFGDSVASEAGVFGQIFNLTNDYTLRVGTIWRWGNSLTILFATQRTLLLGLPLALIILTKAWEIFTAKNERENIAENDSLNDSSVFNPLAHSPFHPLTVAVFTVGLLAGMLPLVHAHSFAVVMGMTGLLALMTWQKWRVWAIFFAAAAVVAIPELLFATTGSENEAQSFLGWKVGWDNGEENPVWFWFVNTGFFIPLVLIAAGWLYTLAFNKKDEAVTEEKPAGAFDKQRARQLLLFYAPFVLCFVVPNLVRLAPWVWDNIKVLIYWYVASIPLVAWLLAEIWRRSKLAPYLVPALLITLTLAGWLDVWRTATRQVEHQILPPAMISLGSQLREKTAPRSLIMTAPEYATVPVLTGRRWFLGYIGHVWSHGIAPYEREQIVKKIYAGGDEALGLIQQNKIDYILVGPQERNFTTVNEAFFQQFPVVAEAGELRVYRVNNSQ